MSHCAADGVSDTTAVERLRRRSAMRSNGVVIQATSETARWLKSEPTLLFQTTAVQILLRILDGATLWFCLFAIGYGGAYWPCFVAIVMAGVASLIVPVPMGLGVFEAGSVAALALFHVPVHIALTATLLFRGLALWLPLVPGFVVLQRELHPADSVQRPSA